MSRFEAFSYYEAETDPYLVKHFMEYSALPRLLSPQALFLLGGKGAGKTAFIKHLKSTQMSHQINLLADNMNYDLVHSEIEYLHDNFHIDHRTIIAVWRHFFVVQVMEYLWVNRNDLDPTQQYKTQFQLIHKYLKELVGNSLGVNAILS